MMAQSQAAELKQQGAVEAARDGNSWVTAEDAERVIVEETKKTGNEAYQFDPNASPEEKAAQAASHVSPQLHYQRQPKASAVVTDLDDVPTANYDLPSPDKAAALAASSSDEVNGDAKKVNGAWTEDENDQWAAKAGWAPRFGSIDDMDRQESTLLDHQTWVETNLSDKFFGDWYHNAGIIAFACLSSWFVAVLGGGLGWVFIILAVCATYYRTSIRRVRRNFRDDIERELAKTKLETDVESLEWINNFLVKFWPIYQPVLAKTIISSVDQVLSTATPAFLDSLRLKMFTLGSKPPRLDYVKTYPKADDDIVLMDWKFSFNPNDVEDLTARQLKNKVNPKVVLEVRIGKAMVSKSLDVIVEDMAFSGLIRLKVKLQLAFPHVERIEFCFLDQPTIDYVCKPLGGDLLGFDMNLIPGLESTIQGLIHANLRPIMYAPNVFPIEVAKMLAGDALDRAIGVLAITLHGAQGLKNTDKFAGTPDPYVSVSLNNKDVLTTTKTIRENASPRWNETKEIIITSLFDTLTLQIFDFNDFRKDKLLGTATFALEGLEKVPEQENLRLEVLAAGKARGILQADVRFFPVLEGRKLEDGTVEPAPESNTGIAKFTVEQAKELDGSKTLIGQLSPYAVLLLNGKEVHTTQKLKRTNNPVWANGSKDILITDKKAAKLGVVIKDDRDLATDPILGTYQIRLDDMVKLMDKGQEWYQLASAKTGRVKLTLNWKPVALKGSSGTGGGYVDPIGVMRIHLRNARNLRNLETVGKSDPYVRILLSGVEKARTVTFNSNLDPDWDEIYYVPMHSDRERLTLEVMDEENLGKDRSLGQVEVMAADYIRQVAPGEYIEHSKTELSDALCLHGKSSSKGTLNYTVAFFPCLIVADPTKEDTPLDDGKTPDDGQEKTEAVNVPNGNSNSNDANAADVKQLAEGETEQIETTDEKPLPKIHLRPEHLVHYESGLIVFQLIEGEFHHSNCRLEVIMDDMGFPSYVSSKAKSKQSRFDETGEAFVRELDVSRITVRLSNKGDHKGDDNDESIVAKITGDTLTTLKQCLYHPTTLTLKEPEGAVNRITVSLRYIPVKMKLDPRESINNMGTVRVDVLDATDLPSADRNGFSDPYCKFILNGKEVFKSSEQKKTLNPVWRQQFEVPVPSKIGADFKVEVYDWDAVGNDDYLGSAQIDIGLLEPMEPKEFKLPLDGKSGMVRLRILFRPSYVTRARHGSSTFSGTLAAPRKILTGVGSAPLKGVGAVSGGVSKGASFLRDGFRKKNGHRTSDTLEVPQQQQQQLEPPKLEVPKQGRLVNGEGTQDPSTPIQTSTMSSSASPGPVHHRTISFGGRSTASMIGGKGSGPPTGTAHFTVVSAEGYPADAKVRVTIRQMTPRGGKDVHKTRSVAVSSSPTTEAIIYENENFKVPCTPDAQFQVVVKDHSTFRNVALGEAPFFVDDSSSTGSGDKVIRVGSGNVTLRTSFTLASEVDDDAKGGVASGNTSPFSGGGSGGGGLGHFRRSVMHRSPGGTTS